MRNMKAWCGITHLHQQQTYREDWSSIWGLWEEGSRVPVFSDRKNIHFYLLTSRYCSVIIQNERLVKLHIKAEWVEACVQADKPAPPVELTVWSLTLTKLPWQLATLTVALATNSSHIRYQIFDKSDPKTIFLRKPSNFTRCQSSVQCVRHRSSAAVSLPHNSTQFQFVFSTQTRTLFGSYIPNKRQSTLPLSTTPATYQGCRRNIVLVGYVLYVRLLHCDPSRARVRDATGVVVVGDVIGRRSVRW